MIRSSNTSNVSPIRLNYEYSNYVYLCYLNNDDWSESISNTPPVNVMIDLNNKMMRESSYTLYGKNNTMYTIVIYDASNTSMRLAMSYSGNWSRGILIYQCFT